MTEEPGYKQSVGEVKSDHGTGTGIRKDLLKDIFAEKLENWNLRK